MAFPVNGVLDTFDRANEGPPLSANWTSIAGGLKVATNLAAGNSAAAENTEKWNVAAYGPNSEAYCIVTTKPGNLLYTGPSVRAHSSPVNSYLALLVQAAGTDAVNLYRIDAGVSTQLGASFSQEVAAGDSLGIEALGSTISAYYKAAAGSWTSLGTRTDSTYQVAGALGLTIYSTTGRLNDFGGGDSGRVSPKLAGVGGGLAGGPRRGLAG